VPAFDGGLVDNVPVEPLTSMETAGRKTLMLLTRLNKKPPSVPGCIVSVAAGRRINRRTSMQSDRRWIDRQFGIRTVMCRFGFTSQLE
jgi:hypothetical protein